MGWWSPTIMGGDAPLDAQYEVLALSGLDDDSLEVWDVDPTRAKRALEAVTLAQWRELFARSGDEEYSGIQKQVAALMLMQVGAALPDELAQAAITACEQEDCMAWREGTDREACLDQFISIIRQYDGTPTQVPSEGLFDKLAEHVGLTSKPRKH